MWECKSPILLDVPKLNETAMSVPSIQKQYWVISNCVHYWNNAFIVFKLKYCTDLDGRNNDRLVVLHEATREETNDLLNHVINDPNWKKLGLQ